MMLGMRLPDLSKILLFQKSVETSKRQTWVDHMAGMVDIAVVTRMDFHRYGSPLETSWISSGWGGGEGAPKMIKVEVPISPTWELISKRFKEYGGGRQRKERALVYKRMTTHIEGAAEQKITK